MSNRFGRNEQIPGINQVWKPGGQIENKVEEQAESGDQAESTGNRPAGDVDVGKAADVIYLDFRRPFIWSSTTFLQAN